MIELIDLPELIAIGILVEAPWERLPVLVPQAWQRLFEMNTGATSFLEVSISREKGLYSELIGYLAAVRSEVPDGLQRLVIPPARYLRTIHDGPLVNIAQGFERLYAYAKENQLQATDFKLDFGYVPGLSSGRHELHIALEEKTNLPALA